MKLKSEDFTPPAVRPTRSVHHLYPYPGTMPAHLAKPLVAHVLSAGRGRGPILDPFCGSGTVMIESQAAGVPSSGWDPNPLACLISRVKATAIRESDVRRMVERVVEDARGISSPTVPPVVNVDYWYFPDQRDELARISESLSTRSPSPTSQLLRLALARTAIEISRTNPRFQVPVRLDPTKYPPDSPVARQLRNREQWLRTVDACSRFRQHASLMAGTVAAHRTQLPSVAQVTVRKRSALDAPLDEELAAGVVTSPPYPGAQKYIRFSSLAACWIGEARSQDLASLEKLQIGRERLPTTQVDRPLLGTGVAAADKILRVVAEVDANRAAVGDQYLRDMGRAFEVITASLLPASPIALVVGPSTFKGLEFDTPAYLTELAEQAGIEVVDRMDSAIRGRRLMTRRRGNSAAIEYEAIISMRTPSQG